MPRDRLHGIGVAFQRVEFCLEVTQIPQPNRLVCRPCRQNRLGGGVEGDRVDSVAVLALGQGSCAIRLGGTGVQNLERDVVGDGSDKRGVEGVVLDIIDDRRMVGISSGRSDCLVALGVCGEVPAIQSGELVNVRVGLASTYQSRTVLSSLPVAR